jgi:putative DNA primase/helicase
VQAPSPEEDEREVARLRKLDPIAYDRQREAAAKQLGIRPATLDEQVKPRRVQAHSPPEQPAHWRVEPWPEAVHGAALLDELAAVFARHVVLPKHGATALALWDLHTWCLEATDTSPFLILKSPERRCGKTTVLTLLHFLAPRSELACNISPAAVFRYIEAVHPTLLVDEADSFVRGSEELRGVLNSGHTRSGAHVIRCVLVGDRYEVRRFSTWAPKAVASIGGLAGTLEDRSVILPMQRKRREQTVARLRSRDNAELARLRSMAARWAHDNLEALSAADATTDVPAQLNDRAADNWRPLLAIADLAGGDWPKRAREAALALSGADEPNSLGTQLLGDIKTAFRPDEHALTTRDLIDRLIADPERPWADYRRGKPLSPKQLGRLLAPFRIASETVHPAGEAHAKGYVRARFDEAWAVYLPSADAGSEAGFEGADEAKTPFSAQEGGSEPCKRASADEAGTSAHFPKRALVPSARFEKAQEMPIPHGFARLHGSKAGGLGETGQVGMGNGVDQAAAPAGAPEQCAHCGKTVPPLRPVQTVADGRVVGSVVLHPSCKDAWVRGVWAAHHARQGTAPGDGA